MNEVRNIFVIAGPSKAGKSTTVRIIAQKLRQYADDPNDPSVPYPKTDYQNSTGKISREREILVRIKINGLYVGLASMGDTVKYLKNKTFPKLETETPCDYIVCCCRDKGSTREYIEDNYSNRVYKWYPLPKLSIFNETKKKEFEVAETIVQDLIRLLYPMNKYIICDYGDAGIGKSKTLTNVIWHLEKSQNAVRIGDMDLIDDGGGIADKNGHPQSDIYAKYIVNGVKITVCTQGDPGDEQPKRLIESAKWGADVIVCAARDDRNGKMNKETVDNIYESESEFNDETGQSKTVEQRFDNYIKIWSRNFFTDKPIPTNIDGDDLCRKMNLCSAKSIVELIERLYNISIL